MELLGYQKRFEPFFANVYFLEVAYDIILDPQLSCVDKSVK